MKDEGWSKQNQSGNKQATLKLCGDDCRIVLSSLLLFLDKEGSHLVFVYLWTPDLLPASRKCRVSLKLLWHCEQPGAAAFWLVNTACVLGTAVSLPGRYVSRRGKASCWTHAPTRQNWRLSSPRGTVSAKTKKRIMMVKNPCHPLSIAVVLEEKAPSPSFSAKR